jgi:hypothetical protein
LYLKNLNTQVNLIKDTLEQHKSYIEKHDSEIMKQMEEINKLKELDEKIQKLSEKTRYKIKKSKSHFDNITTKQENRLKLIEGILGQSIKNGSQILNENDASISKQFDISQLRQPVVPQVLNDRYKTKEYEILKKHYNEINDKFKGTIDSHDEDIKNLKLNYMNINLNEKSNYKLENIVDEENKFSFDEEIDPSMYGTKIKDIMNKLSDVEIANQKIFTLLVRKCEKDDLFKFEKVLNLEIDKIVIIKLN